jgi:hypothetical protein
MMVRGTGLAIAALMLAACGGKEETDCCAKIQPPQAAQAAPSPAPPTAPPDAGGFVPPPAADPALAAACTNGLKARGLASNELMLMAHTPDGICPNNGVTEARIRAILDKDWEAAGCRQYSKAEMLKALNDGACGGDAG